MWCQIDTLGDGQWNKHDFGQQTCFKYACGEDLGQ